MLDFPSLLKYYSDAEILNGMK